MCNKIKQVIYLLFEGTFSSFSFSRTNCSLQSAAGVKELEQTPVGLTEDAADKVLLQVPSSKVGIVS